MDNQATVYVVDDDRELLQALRWLLESAHFGVETFGSAQEFLDAYDPAQPGCLLLDVRMPGMSGIELQQILKSQNKTIPVVFLTGHGDVPMAVQCLNSGGFHFLEKPFKDEELLDQISAAIRKDERTAALTGRDRRDTVRVVAAPTTPPRRSRLRSTPHSRAISARMDSRRTTSTIAAERSDTSRATASRPPG